MKTLVSTWLVAAVTSALTAVWIGATMIDLIPKTTWIDVAALFATGYLSGLFTAFHVTQRRLTRV